MHTLNRSERPTDGDIERFLDALTEAPVPFRVTEALRAASQLVEYAAFEGARVLAPDTVAALIDIAADLQFRVEQSVSPSF